MSEVTAEAIAERLRLVPAVAQVGQALGNSAEAWIVGGAVRDLARGRAVADLDLVVGGDPRAAAGLIAREGGGHSFELSAEFGIWRATSGDGDRQIDVSGLRGGSIEADLGERDFTAGAVAVPLRGGPAVDPFGGLEDLRAGILRAVGERSFAADPLRLLRAARLAAELELEVEAGTLSLARAEARRAGEPAGERQLAELRLLIMGPAPLRGLALMDELSITAAVLPELEALRGVEQNPNHHLDVHGHTLAVLTRLLEVEAELDRYAGERAGELRTLLGQPLGDDFSRGGALRLGALVHDVGKPATRGERGGYVTFIGHDREGARIVGEMCLRLRTSRRLAAHLQGLTRHHLRLGFLVHERPLPRRRVHDYLRATEPVSVDVTLLTIADRLSARGTGPIASEEMVEAHLELAAEMIAAGLDWSSGGPPPPLLRGDELAAELGIEPGPRVGELLRELEAAQYAGEVTTREQALRLARAAM
jgi:putative nucleotidyltransferase with HDIG domain